MRAMIIGIITALAVVVLGSTASVVAAERVDTAAQPVTLTVPIQDRTDVLRTDYERVPDQLWDALRRDGFRGVIERPVNLDRLYVPFGTVVDVRGGLYLATIDGWFACADFTTSNAECSGTSPVVPIGDGRVSGFFRVPPFSPSGAGITGPVYEDGSAGYTDGLMFDPEQRMFRLTVRISR